MPASGSRQDAASTVYPPSILECCAQWQHSRRVQDTGPARRTGGGICVPSAAIFPGGISFDRAIGLRRDP